MVALMAAKREAGEKPSDRAKVTIAARIPPTAAEQLEQLAKEKSEIAHPGRVTVSQLVELAVMEYLERNRGKGKAGK